MSAGKGIVGPSGRTDAVENDDACYWKQLADDLTRLIQKANAPIFGIDTAGRVSEWNDKTEAITGYSKTEAIGKSLVKTYIEPENRTSVDEVLSKALCGIETANFELPVVSKSGKRYTVLLNATTRRNSEGQVTGVVGVGQDISELKEVVAESKRVAEGLVRLIETANAPIFGIDTKGKVTEWNATAARLLGFSKEVDAVVNQAGDGGRVITKEGLRELETAVVQAVCMGGQ